MEIKIGIGDWVEMEIGDQRLEMENCDQRWRLQMQVEDGDWRWEMGDWRWGLEMGDRRLEIRDQRMRLEVEIGD